MNPRERAIAREDDDVKRAELRRQYIEELRTLDPPPGLLIGRLTAKQRLDEATMRLVQPGAFRRKD